MKVAIVHYWFVTRRGGEKVVESILRIFPQADIYTLFYDRESYGDFIENHKIYSSVLDRRFLRRHYQKLFPLYPLGIKSLKLRQDYDLVISSESGPAKGIAMPAKCPHLCYIHSPMRYCWGFTQEYLNSMSKPMRPIARFFFNRLRAWDKTTIDNVTYYIANSYNVAERVKRYYNRESHIIHPPIALSLFESPMTLKKGTTYLSFGAITPYKRIDLLVDTFNENGKRLMVIGDGSEKNKLEVKSKENISFLGNLDWPSIKVILRNTSALIFPGEEDFGMIPLEVMAFGIPVLAYRKGGALETVVENLDAIGESSGLFFDAQTSESIQTCIDKFEVMKEGFDKQWIRNHARGFGEDYFVEKFKLFLKEKT